MGKYGSVWDGMIADKSTWSRLEVKSAAILNYLTKYTLLSEELIEFLLLKLNWYTVFENQKLSEEFIKKVYPRVCLMYELDSDESHEKFKQLIKYYQKVTI